MSNENLPGTPSEWAPIRESDVEWTTETDVVILGSGAGGLSTATTALSHGLDVVILEKGSTLGGTTAKAAASYWIPNNRYMREQGIDDPKPDFLRFTARLARPKLYDERHETLGIPAWEHELLGVFYDHASDAVEYLESLGSFKGIPFGFPDYMGHIPQDKAKVGRLIAPATDDGLEGNGRLMVERFRRWIEEHGGTIHLDHRARRLVVSDEGAVVGVVAESGTSTKAFKARRGVVFATGGFTHNQQMRLSYLNPAIFPGCGAVTNEGDFVSIASASAIPLFNMTFAWQTPIPLEKTVHDHRAAEGAFFNPGDSVIWVNKYGQRVMNEKTIYNEACYKFMEWDWLKAEYPNLVQFLIYDDHARTHFNVNAYGNPIFDNEGDNAHVIVADTLEELRSLIAERLAKVSHLTGGVALDEGFLDELQTSISRFNDFARAGKDDDFGRGETPIEQMLYGQPTPENSYGNGAIFPLSDKGPFYCVILVAATLDTKGGPRVDRWSRVLDATGQPITGLYGVGNCVASPSAQGYFAGGATIGPILTFGYLAGHHLAGVDV